MEEKVLILGMVLLGLAVFGAMFAFLEFCERV